MESQVGIRAEGTNSELCDADSSWRGPCLPDGATVAVRPLHDRVLERPRLGPGAPPGLPPILLGCAVSPRPCWRMPSGVLPRDILRLSAGLAALPVSSRLAFADTYPSRP